MIELSEVLDSWKQVSPEVRKLMRTFMSSEGNGRRYVLGRNQHSVALSKVIEIDGFVDDFAEIGTKWNGKPVIKGTDVPSKGIVVNCSMCISPVSAAKRLTELNIAGVLAFSDLCRAFPDQVCLPHFVLQTRQDLYENTSKWKHLAESLADDQSMSVIDDLIRYRVTGDYSFMSSYSVRLKDQYFDDVLSFTSGEIFVDAGGYDGNTTEEFCRRCPGYGKVFLFEPSSDNLSRAVFRLRNVRDIEFLNFGLSDVVGTVLFDPSAGSASSIKENGLCKIDVTTLDHQIRSKITFIKMDIEGWELKALEGARRHILEDCPKLAIAVYHHPAHFWKVFDLMKCLKPAYKVYLRHYTEGWSETVMFFIPR